MLILRLRPMWLRLDQWKLFSMITSRDDFISSQGVVEHRASTYMTRNAHFVKHVKNLNLFFFLKKKKKKGKTVICWNSLGGKVRFFLDLR